MAISEYLEEALNRAREDQVDLASCPGSRERALVVTKLQEAIFWEQEADEAYAKAAREYGK